MEFEGKVVLVTGAGGYIGGQAARDFAAEGAIVAVCDINESTMRKTVDDIVAAGGKAKAYKINVTDYDDVVRVVNDVVKDWGKLDISVHVAGGSARIYGRGVKYLPIVKQDIDVIKYVVDVNLYGAIYLAKAAATRMIEQNTGGRIISFSSIVGINGLKNLADYAAAKAGVVGFSKALAKELGPYGITVNTVAPGVVQRPDSTAGDEYTLDTNLLHKKCLATDITNMVLYLASEKGRFITGENIVIDGGRSLSMKGSD